MNKKGDAKASPFFENKWFKKALGCNRTRYKVKSILYKKRAETRVFLLFDCPWEHSV